MIVPGNPMPSPTGAGGSPLGDPSQQPNGLSMLIAAANAPDKMGREKGTVKDKMAPKKLNRRLKVI